MVLCQPSVLSVVILALFLVGCASPILKEGETAQIIEVNVTKKYPDMGTENLAEDIRFKTQNAAFRFSESGPEKILKLELVTLDLPNPVKALLIGGGSAIGANATLTDISTGKATEEFPVLVLGGGFGGAIGAAQAIATDQVHEEQRLASLLAEQTMERIYGGERAERVAGRTPRKQISPSYPMSYADAHKRYECRNTQSIIESEISEAELHGEPPGILTELPEHCVALLESKPESTASAEQPK